MTGLDCDTDVIIEIFCIITDGFLNVIDPEGWGTVVHQSQETMDAMGDWCTKTHGETGLTAVVLSSKVTPEQAADELYAYIKRFIPEPRLAQLAGNSVHADKDFLKKEPYKKVIEHLDYRIIDVSSIKEVTKRWRKDVMKGAPVKKGLHQAKADILESIGEMKYYKRKIWDMIPLS
jgi:oligoribonuclease